ncbi:hypothetical protein [Psittacicella gerlachiana]|uniref:Uncharacterized protein n=1 Tax=Psittacicella gerlachiana TaxID=2028574 RepID=A0A3A1YGJ8_9GAMM|nr:hypothetical protein [Psittacicella gerlachiana]RIY36805.1 hypothetical protein CKF59_02255 [Psittacicella gerlachiana]
MKGKLMCLVWGLGMVSLSSAQINIQSYTQNPILRQVGSAFLQSSSYQQAMAGDKTQYLRRNFDLTKAVVDFYVQDPSLKGSFPESPFMDNLYNYGFYFMQSRFRDDSVEKNLQENVPMALEAVQFIIYLSYINRENALASKLDPQVIIKRAYQNYKNFNLPTFMAQYINFCATPNSRVDLARLAPVYQQRKGQALTSEQLQILTKYATNLNVFMQTTCEQFLQLATVYTTPGSREFDQALQAFVYTDKSLITEVKDYQYLMYGRPDMLYKGVDFNNAQAQNFKQAFLSEHPNGQGLLTTYEQSYINFIKNLAHNDLAQLAFKAQIGKK